MRVSALLAALLLLLPAPSCPNAEAERASELAKQGRLEEAILHSAKAAELSPRDAGLLVHHGALLQNSAGGSLAPAVREQRWLDAMKAFDTARELEPTSASAFLNSAIVSVLLSHEGAVELHARRAEEFAAQAKALRHPDWANAEKVHASAWAARAAAAGKHAKPPRLDEQRECNENAVACYDRVLARTPKDAFSLHYRGARLENLRRYDEALLSFAASSELVPTAPEAWEAAALTHVHLSQYEAALAAAEKAVSAAAAAGAAPTVTGGAYRSMGDAYGGMGRHSEATTSFENAVFGIKDDAALWARLGASRWVWYAGTREATEPYAQAVEAYDNALRLEPLLARTITERAFARGFVAHSRGAAHAAEQAPLLLAELERGAKVHTELLKTVSEAERSTHS